MKTILERGQPKQMTFEEVYTQYQPLIKKMAYQWQNIEDVRQISEIELWKAYETYNPLNKISFTHYAQVVISKKLLQINNRNQMQKRKGEAIEYDDSLKSGTIDNNIAEKLDLHKAINILPEVQKTMLLLICYGYTQTEIANMFNISQASAYRKLREAKNQLIAIC